MKTIKQSYSFAVGIWKTLKNVLIVLSPFIIAGLTGIPQEYAWIASPVIYFIKNYIQNK